MPINPFSKTDTDRAAIWEMLVARDIQAFTTQNWSIVAGDFITESFMAVDGRNAANPDGWVLSFPDIESYKAEWLGQAAAFMAATKKELAESTLYRVITLRDIEIRGDIALAHKKFRWDFKRDKGDNVPADWQTIYHCRRVNGSWKISGFIGYLPIFSGSAGEEISRAAIRVPENASQHKTSGPYSPVLIIEPGKLVVISGQAAIDMEGNFIGETIEEQAAYTLDNCRKQLAVAGCGMDKVFKVTVYLKDITDWGKFNAVYVKYFGGATKPVRTAVQAGLLGTLLVEVECWAVL